MLKNYYFWSKFTKYLLILLSTLTLFAAGQNMVLFDRGVNPVLAEEDDCLNPDEFGCPEPGDGGQGDPLPPEPPAPPPPPPAAPPAAPPPPPAQACSPGAFDRQCTGQCGGCESNAGEARIFQCRADGSGMDQIQSECRTECAGPCAGTPPPPPPPPSGGPTCTPNEVIGQTQRCVGTQMCTFNIHHREDCSTYEGGAYNCQNSAQCGTPPPPPPPAAPAACPVGGQAGTQQLCGGQWAYDDCRVVERFSDGSPSKYYCEWTGNRNCIGDVSCPAPAAPPPAAPPPAAPPPPPAAQALNVNCVASPSTGNIGDIITWSASASGGSGNYTYSWTGVSGSGSTIQNSYSSSGVKTASVSVTDSAGNRGQSSNCSVTINQVGSAAAGDPSCYLSPSNPSGSAPLSVNFTINGSTPNGSITSYLWDETSSGSFVTGSQSRQVTYYSSSAIRARVVDSIGRSAECSTPITITAAQQGSPICVISPSSQSGYAPYTTSFSSSATPTSGRSISAYAWDLNGDGSYGDSTGQSASYTYNNSSNVSLRVTDSAGQLGYCSGSVTILPPVGSVGQLSCIISPQSISGVAPLNASFTANTTLPSGRSISGYAWDLNGDGSYTDASSQTVSATYNASSNISLRVTDSAGQTAFCPGNITIITTTQVPTAAGNVGVGTSAERGDSTTTTNTNTNTNTVTVNTPAQGGGNPVVLAINRPVTGVPVVKVAGLTELPKTGLPVLAWMITAFIPLGFRVRGFGSRNINSSLKNHPSYLSENRRFKI